MKEIVPGILTWPWFSERHGYDFNGYLIRLPGGNGMDILKKGGDTLDAVIAAVTVVEDDPNDTSVGYGGLPNEEGVVELDACCMHGPTRRAGSCRGCLREQSPDISN